MKFGIDRLLEEPALRKPLAGRRVALLAHPASVTADLVHSLDALRRGGREAHRGVRSAARPARRQAGQHDRVAGLQRPGARHPGVQPVRQGAPPDAADDGSASTSCSSTCRTSAAASTPSSRPCATCSRRRRATARASGCSTGPNPAGRPIEGLKLQRGLGELRRRRARCPCATGSRWAKRRTGSSREHLDLDVEVIEMQGWEPGAGPGLRLAARRARLGEPEPERAEPVDGALLSRHGDARGHDAVRRPRHHATAGNPWRARPRRECTAPKNGFAGTRLAARLPPARLLVRADLPQARRQALRRVADPCRGTGLRAWLLSALAAGRLAFKALRTLRPDYPLWRDFPYEYETRLPIDVINGGGLLREWVDDPAARPGDLDAAARADEEAWRDEREAVLLYR